MRNLLTCLFSLIIAAPLIAESTDFYTVIEDCNPLHIKTPSLKNRQIKKICLHNGLEVCMIHDPQVTKSSAGIVVEVGKWDDPVEYPGTAHFLEHMLFMGSKKYPEEEEYFAFIANHGGQTNAFTSFDHTAYGASIDHDAFVEYLDRLAHFFTSPLLSESGISREFKAVDNENTNYMSNDSRRFLRVLQETSNPSHPFHRFSTGNSETLSHIPHAVLKEWFEKHYSSDRMHLMVISPIDLDTLTSQIVSSFGQIPRRITHPHIPYQLLFQKDQKGSKITIKPIKDVKQLTLIWELPFKQGSLNNEMHAQLIANIIAAKTPNSLYQTLLQEGSIEDLSAFAMRFSHDNIIFLIDLSLTEQGLKNQNQVIKQIFAAINTYQKSEIPTYLYHEMKQMQTLAYEFSSRPENPFNETLSNASEMVYENLSSYPYHSRVIGDFHPNTAKDIFSVLTPEECVLIVTGTTNETAPLDQKEYYYGIEYAITPFSQKDLRFLASQHNSSQFCLPKQNPFIPNQLELITRSSTQVSIPTLIDMSERGKLYYKEDTQFLNPETVFKIGLVLPNVNPSLKSKVLTKLYMIGVKEHLAELFSYARAAEMHLSLQLTNGMLLFSFEGFSDQAKKVILQFFDKLHHLNISSTEFDKYKQMLAIKLSNEIKNLPIYYANSVLKSVLYNDCYTGEESLSELQSIYFEDFNDFQHTLFHKMYLKGYVTGNITKQDAKNVYQQISDTLCNQPFPLRDHPEKKVLKLSSSDSPKHIALRSPQLGFASILLIQVGKFSPYNQAIQLLLSRGISNMFFDDIRTKQQLGYLVHATHTEAKNELMQLFYTQSASCSAQELLLKHELFIENWIRHIHTNISEERFDTLKTTLLKELRMPDNNLNEMADREFALTYEYDEDYERKQRVAEAIENLDYTDFTQRATAMLSLSNPRRIAVLVKGVCPPGQSPTQEEGALDHFNYAPTTPELLRKEAAYSGHR